MKTKSPEEMQRIRQLEALDLLGAVEKMKELRGTLDAIKAQKTLHQADFDALRLHIIPALMDEDGITNVTFDEVGRVTLTGDVYASIPAPKAEMAFKWLRDNNHGGLIKETVNSGTLKAFIKNQIKKGEEIPDDIFKVTPYSRATITKLNKK